MTQSSARTVFALVVILTASATRAGAQVTPQPVMAPGIWNAAVAAIEADRPRPDDWREPVGPERRPPSAASQGQRSFPRPGLGTGAQKVIGAFVGTVGGFFAGGLIGGVLDRNCRCDDPGLAGLVIGAPIGAIAGGVLGFTLAGR